MLHLRAHAGIIFLFLFPWSSTKKQIAASCQVFGANQSRGAIKSWFKVINLTVLTLLIDYYNPRYAQREKDQKVVRTGRERISGSETNENSDKGRERERESPD